MDEIFEQSLLIMSMLMTAVSASYLLWASFGSFTSLNSKHLQVVGQITEIKSDAKRKESDNFEWDDLGTNEKAFNDDTIFTGSDSELSLKLKSGGTLKIGSNTLIFLSQDIIGKAAGNSKLTEISLVRGNIGYTGDGSSPGASPINVNMGTATVSGNSNSSYQIVRNSSEAEVVAKQGQVQILAGNSIDAQKVSLAPDEASRIKNISTDPGKNAEIQKQTKIVPIQPLSMSETDHVATRGDISQVTREVPLLSESSLFGEKSNGAQSVAMAEPITAAPTPKAVEKPRVAPVIAAQPPASKPKATAKPKTLNQKMTAPLPAVEDSSGISGKAVVSQGGFQLDPTAEVKVTDKLNAIKFSWKSEIKDVGQFNIQFSATSGFDSNTIDYKISEDEVVVTKTDKASYSLDLEPNKYIHLTGFLDTAYKNRFVFWRAVPVDKNGAAQGSLQSLPVQKVTFKFSSTADIKSGISMYSEPTDSNSIVIARWTLKNIIPSQYQVTLSANADLSVPLCQKTIAKDVFQGSKPKGPISLTFNEQAILENSEDCKIDQVLKAKKKLYFGVTAQDLSGRTVHFTNPAKALGSLNLL
jgi:hypothetical protein